MGGRKTLQLRAPAKRGNIVVVLTRCTENGTLIGVRGNDWPERLRGNHRAIVATGLQP